MKQRKIRAWVMALAVAACLAPLAPAITAQNQKPSAQQPTAPQKQDVQKTYYGKIVKLKNGKYGLLINAKEQRGYFLDDQKTAKKYAEKKALVTGTVDHHTGMLHVVKIKPVP